jgi:hypothetical protein
MASTKLNTSGNQHRSAKSGQYVTKQYAKTHPATTVTETNSKPKGKK